MSLVSKVILGAALSLVALSPAIASSCSTFPYMLTNGTTADASQVMADFTAVGTCAAPLASPSFTGNVGVGTTTSGSGIELDGDSQITAALTDAGTRAGVITVFGGIHGLAGEGGAITFGNIQSKTAGAIGFAAIKGLLTGGGLNTTGDLAFSTRNFYSDTALTERLRITAGGLVGIGTSTPTDALVVAGVRTVTISPNNAAGLGYGVNITGDTGGWATGYTFTGSSGSALGGFGAYGSGNTLGRYFIGTFNTGELISVQSNGFVGIGTTAPAVKLAVVGDIQVGTSGSNGCLQNFAGGALAGTCSSDAALKTVVGEVTDVLDKLAGLQLVRFRWNATAENVYHDKPAAVNTGFIAQSVQAQFPELVTVDTHGYRQLDYTTLSLYGLEAIKELKAANDRLARTNEHQATQIQDLQARLLKLEALVPGAATHKPVVARLP